MTRIKTIFCFIRVVCVDPRLIFLFSGTTYRFGIISSWLLVRLFRERLSVESTADRLTNSSTTFSLSKSLSRYVSAFACKANQLTAQFPLQCGHPVTTLISPPDSYLPRAF